MKNYIICIIFVLWSCDMVFGQKPDPQKPIDSIPVDSLMLSLLSPDLILFAGDSKNYMQITTFTNANRQDSVRQVLYYDGLGRPSLKFDINYSPNQ